MNSQPARLSNLQRQCSQQTQVERLDARASVSSATAESALQLLQHEKSSPDKNSQPDSAAAAAVPPQLQTQVAHFACLRNYCDMLPGSW